MIDRLAAALAARGRWLLVVGLVAGLAEPALGAALRPWLAPFLGAILCVAMLRQGIVLRGWRMAAAQALLWQGALPCAAALVLLPLGLAATPWGLALILILAAAPITGAGPIASMAGADGAPALRQTIVGTFLLPLTVLPVFALIPALGDTSAVLGAALRLGLVIGLSAGAAVLLGPVLRRGDSTRLRVRLDALQAVLLAVVVVAIMSGAAQVLRADPLRFAVDLTAVCVLVVALQALALRLWRGRAEAVSMAVAAANRNVALFLAALPEALVLSVLPVIGAYQVPMYMTPLVLPLVLRHLGGAR